VYQGARVPYQGSDDTGRYAVLQEVNICQIKLAHFVFLGCSDGILDSLRRGQQRDVRSLIGESRDRHTHPSGADEPGDKNEQIGLIAWELSPDRLGYWNKEHAGYCVADERRDDLRE
jgi:hypothetical protein